MMPKMQLMEGCGENVLGRQDSKSNKHLLHVHFLGKTLLEPHRVEELLLLVRESVVLVGRSALQEKFYVFNTNISDTKQATQVKPTLK